MDFRPPPPERRKYQAAVAKERACPAPAAVGSEMNDDALLRDHALDFHVLGPNNVDPRRHQIDAQIDVVSPPARR